MPKLIGQLLVIVLLVAFPGLSLAEVVVAGTGDSQAVLRAIASGYHEHYPDESVEVSESIGSSGGVKAAAAGLCDIGRVARPLKPKEKELGLTYKVFGYSPVVFVVNAAVTGVEGVTSEQLVDIYSGKITNWKQLGGPDSKIFVVSREQGDSSRSVLKHNLPGFSEHGPAGGQTYFSTPEARDGIIGNPAAIGYLPEAMANSSFLRVLTIDGISASRDSVLKGDYKLVTPLGLVWKEPLSQSARKFMIYLFSSEAERQMKQFGVVPATN